MLLFSSHEQGFMLGHMMGSKGESPVKQRRETLIDGSGFFCARREKKRLPEGSRAKTAGKLGLARA
ncbi:hypothetical protein FOC84_32450 [Achromobacter pestifer]|uniref:Uncharacterized protein n=1 Tax=Achromobacter pestifer TaxID=1353889 RepID=A0A7D4HV72_9BURK|nr:hypothetical protein [Achromobacter pestifer]QKH39397.1 hypothetical protein FOC84_32450 [Achromobacter pestifer]